MYDMLCHCQGAGAPSTTTSNLLLGSIAVHTPYGERSRGLMASPSLISPALSARSTTYNSRVGAAPGGDHRENKRKRRVVARTLPQASATRRLESTSKSRAVARIPKP
jgi:hypothetical protein